MVQTRASIPTAKSACAYQVICEPNSFLDESDILDWRKTAQLQAKLWSKTPNSPTQMVSKSGLMTLTPERFHIPGMRALAQFIAHECIPCCRTDDKSCCQLIGPPPAERV